MGSVAPWHVRYFRTHVPCIGRQILIHCTPGKLNLSLLVYRKGENKCEGTMLLLALWVLLPLLSITLGEHVKGNYGQYCFSWMVAEDWTSDLPGSLLLLITLSPLPGSVLLTISCSGCLLYRYTLSPNTESTRTDVVTHTSESETFISFCLLDELNVSQPPNWERVVIYFQCLNAQVFNHFLIHKQN